MTEILTNLERELQETEARISDFSPWMAQVLIALPNDPGYKKLNPHVREEIETIIAGIE